jgi:hypothetical protein
MISSGVALASHGELRFNLIGFLVQAAAVGVRTSIFFPFPFTWTQSRQFEASRLVMIQILLHGLKMDPLVSLHYYAPVCALINLAILPFTEGFAPFFALARVGPLILLSNAALAFGLNVAAVFLVGAGSGLVLTLAGVFKVCGRRASYAADVHPFHPFSGYPSYLRLCIDLRLANYAAPGFRFVSTPFPSN